MKLPSGKVIGGFELGGFLKSYGEARKQGNNISFNDFAGQYDKYMSGAGRPRTQKEWELAMSQRPLQWLKQPAGITPSPQPQPVQQPQQTMGLLPNKQVQQPISKPLIPFQIGYTVNPDQMAQTQQPQQPQATQPKQTFTGYGGLFRNLLDPSYYLQKQQLGQDDYSDMGLSGNRGLYPSSMYNQQQYSNLLSPRYNNWNRR